MEIILCVCGISRYLDPESQYDLNLASLNISIVDVRVNRQGFEKRVVSQDLQLWLSNVSWFYSYEYDVGFHHWLHFFYSHLIVTVGTSR